MMFHSSAGRGRSFLFPIISVSLIAGCATTDTTDFRRPEEMIYRQQTAVVPKQQDSVKPISVRQESDQAPAGGPDVRSMAFVTARGETVTLRYRDRSESLGFANKGSLEGGRVLREEGPGFIHTHGESWATDETITLLMFALGEVLRDYPDTAGVVIGSLSKEGGGPLPPHKSHQSGRDVDIGFYAINNRQLRSFEHLPPEEIDFEKTMWLIANLVATGRVQMIFVNYSLQPHLYEAAQALGYDEGQLDLLFQYPRDLKSKKGIIRHSAGHVRHLHFRFVCPLEDENCTD